MHQDRVVSLRLLKVVSDAYTRHVGDAVFRMNSGEITTAEGLNQIYAARDSIQQGWRLFQERNFSLPEAELVRGVQPLMSIADQEIEGILRAIEIFQENGNRMLANQLTMIQGSIDPSVRQVGEALDALARMQLNLAEQEFQDANTRFIRNFILMAIILALCTTIAIIASIIIYQKIMIQLHHMVPILQRITQGELTSLVQTDSTDELGTIAEGINAMVKSLRIMIGHISHGSSHLAENAKSLLQISELTIKNSRRYASHSASAANALTQISASISTHARSLANIGISMEQKILNLDPEQFNHPTAADHSTFQFIRTSTRQASKELLQTAHDLNRITRASELAKESALRSAQELESIQTKAKQIHTLSMQHSAVIEKFTIRKHPRSPLW
jgi:methyl-accepting chemotaxis protein